MPRCRAFLAILLALTWCSAAWHVDLEAAGLLLEHSHQAHGEGEHRHGPVESVTEHEQFFARNLTKDSFRPNSPWTSLVLFPWIPETEATTPAGAAAMSLTRQRRETGPPFAGTWHFVQRCAPDSVAPPQQS